MTWYTIVANGIPFRVYAASLRTACVSAGIHLAWLADVRTVADATVREIT